MTYMPLRTVTIDLGNLRGQIFSRTEFAPSEVAVRRAPTREEPVWMSDALRRRRPDGPGGTFVLAPVDHFIGRPGSAVIARILSSEPAPRSIV